MSGFEPGVAGPQLHSYGVWGLGFRAWGLGFRDWGLGFRVLGFGFRVSGLDQNLGFRALLLPTTAAMSIHIYIYMYT